jgi:hypothetical protein
VVHLKRKKKCTEWPKQTKRLQVIAGKINFMYINQVKQATIVCLICIMGQVYSPQNLAKFIYSLWFCQKYQ